jgi:hypothetical protein
MTRIIGIILLLLICAAPAMSQRGRLTTFDYEKADSTALNHPKRRYDDAAGLARQLCTDLHSEHEKFRVIFRWISHNIEYRYGRSGTDANEILKKKKAICEGYSSLLEAMCSAVDIRCETVIGYGKSNPLEDIPQKMKVTNHSWNAVFLAGEWHLVDATWAAGSVDPKRRKFTREFKEHWYLSDPDFFIHTHYPEDERWLLNSKTLKKKQFKKAGILRIDGYTMGMKPTGKPKGKYGNKFKMSFTTDSDIEWAMIKFLNQKEPQGVLLIRNGAEYELRQEFEKNWKGAFYLYLDGKPVMSFVKKD